VVDGRTGFLVAPRDDRALARRLMHCYSDSAIRSVLSKQAQRRANELFTWEKVTVQIASLYEEVLARRAGLPRCRFQAATRCARSTISQP